MLLAAMRAYPENSEFGVRVEYGTLCRHYFSRKTALLFQCVSTAVVALVGQAQMDSQKT